MTESSRALEAIDRILNRGGDADDVLRAVVAELVKEPGIEWASISFLDHGNLVPGPHAGTAAPDRRVNVPVTYRAAAVGELTIDGEAERALLERVALRISAHVLLGWDTGGETWDA